MINNLISVVVSNQRTKCLILISVLSGLAMGCDSQKYAQCQDLIAIANGVTERAKKVTESSQEKAVEMKTWLQTADIMNVAAQEIESLPIKDPTLIDYQGNLAYIFRVYSQATYDAVEAREIKNPSALKNARDNAQKAAKLNKTLVNKVNSYCVLE